MKRYAIGLAVDGTHTEIVLDKQPDIIYDWKSASEIAMGMAQELKPYANIELLYAKAFHDEEMQNERHRYNNIYSIRIIKEIQNG